MSEVSNQIPSVESRTTELQETTPLSAIVAECAAYAEQMSIFELAKASCEHYYCKICFEQVVQTSIDSIGAFPPTCCKVPISFGVVASHVSIELYDRYRQRQAEVMGGHGLYCAIAHCAVRIPKTNITKTRAKCPACHKFTCTLCRGATSEDDDSSHVCNTTKDKQVILSLAKEEEWQACFNCGNLVELNFGCHHMT